jgi:peptidoglycan/LPS O-acetylase OafA/YrhL
MTDKTYRPDVDGLRAIAIVAVVAYHVGIRYTQSGFLGVDIFFVISGYLITGILLREATASGRIDIANFYARRVRRILPALSLMLIGITLAGFFLLNPYLRWGQLGIEGSSAALFVSNVYYWQTSGYFGPTANALVFLHTWSLGVEEQFYLVWPLLLLGLIALSRWTRRSWSLTVGLIILLLASWGVAHTLMASQKMVVFYMMPTRIWEFAAGALAACPVVLTRKPGRLAAAVQPIGLLIIGLVMAHNRLVPPAGIDATLITAASAAILVGGAWAPTGPGARLLSLAPLPLIGRLSYGWYLWHWPLLALTRMITGQDHAPVRDILICLAALGLAALSWHFVEQPVRQRRPGPFAGRWSTLGAGAGIIVACLIATNLWWVIPKPKLEPNSPVAMVAEVAKSGRPLHCEAWALEPLCTLGLNSTPSSILVLGDSHLAIMRQGLAQTARENPSFRMLLRSSVGCLPTDPGHAPVTPCDRHNSLVRQDVQRAMREDRVRGVLIIAYWDRVPGHWPEDVAREVHAFRAAGLRVALVAENPVLPRRAPECILRRPANQCGLSRASFQAQRQQTMAQLAAIAGNDPDVRVVDTIDLYCDKTACPVVQDGALTYSDTNHLSDIANLQVARALKPQIDWLLAGA